VARRALVAGATGLVGSRLVDVLLADADYTEIHLLVRRPFARKDARLREHLIDFAALGAFTWPAVDDLYSCLGTTIRAAGSQQAFRAVDYDLPLAIARGALGAGATQFLFISAMGADPGSSVFYSRVKGEFEIAAAVLGFPATIAFRPSLLAGERSEHRFGERIALAVMQPVRWLLPRKYRPVADVAVARAMVAYAKCGLTGFHVVMSDEIQAAAPG
jgi:uncharacterized protein YbjT (DUF2867 family)